MENGGISVVKLSGDYSSSCGYCGSSDDTSVSFGMTATRLTVQDYQDLLDRGWRRSGTWLYYPLYEKTCCVCYTHRLDIKKFVRTKAQVKTMRRFQNYLSGADLRKAADGDREGHNSGSSRAGEDHRGANVSQDEEAVAIEAALERAVQKLRGQGIIPESVPAQPAKVKPPRAPSLLASGVTHTCPVAYALSSQIKRTGAPQQAPAEVAELLAAAVDTSVCPVVEATGGHLNFFGRQRGAQQADPGAISHPQSLPSASTDRASISQPYQEHQSGKGMKRSADSMSGCGGGGVAGRRLEVLMKRSSPALVALEFPLFRKYQMIQHGEPSYKSSPTSFKRFLIDTPLVPLEAADCPPGTAPPCGFGSFHQQYWIDGVLVAVGVVDILPGCLSSKYFFWDPDLAPLALGKVSAMLEIDWLLAANTFCPNLKYYYMGYFIYTCPKMRYKTEFAPADLLCPKRLIWIPFDRLTALLEAQTERALSEAPGATDGLGEEYTPTHLKRPGLGGRLSAGLGPDIDVLDIKAVVPGSPGTALSLSKFIEHGVLSPIFVQHYGSVLIQLSRGLGPVAGNIAIML